MATVGHKKSLGQHFLEDERILEAIVDGAGLEPEDRVLEIGPGTGAMTARLARRVKQVVAVEVDLSLKPFLEANLQGYANTRVIFGDFLTMKASELQAAFRGAAFKVVANLPYYITSSILERLFDGRLPITSITVLIQKEAAARLISPPGSRDYGVLTVTCAYWGRGERLFDVAPEAFNPPPKVVSTVVHLEAYGEKPFEPCDESAFFRLVKTAFLQRRKQLKNTLAPLGLGREALAEAFRQARVDPSLRAEALSVSDYVRLTNAITKG